LPGSWTHVCEKAAIWRDPPRTVRNRQVLDISVFVRPFVEPAGQACVQIDRAPLTAHLVKRPLAIATQRTCRLRSARLVPFQLVLLQELEVVIKPPAIVLPRKAARNSAFFHQRVP